MRRAWLSAVSVARLCPWASSSAASAARLYHGLRFRRPAMRYRILVVLEKANRNYSAYAPDVPGCIATGKTIEDTLENMREALEIHLHSMSEAGDEMPETA